MRYIYQHTQEIILKYDGSLPLSHFLKNYFKQHPKLGSRDRKALNEILYAYFRTRKGLEKDIDIEETIEKALTLCGSSQSFIIPFLPKEAVNIDFAVEQLLPFDMSLSNGIDRTDWLQSMLKQPDVFLRIRKDKGEVLRLLAKENIPYQEHFENCIAIPNGKPIDKILPAQTYVVQDASSQQTGYFFNARDNEYWWDCCSGAGGKSLLLKDKIPSVMLTVSDKRSSISHNLVQRFQQYGHKLHQQHVMDITDVVAISKHLGNQLFDGIICDVPCTGSGTWARTPEQLYFFNGDMSNITSLQKTIASNALAYLKPGAKMIYITCSVFKAENEDVIAKVLDSNRTVSLEESKLINGINNRADSMFVAVLRKTA